MIMGNKPNSVQNIVNIEIEDVLKEIENSKKEALDSLRNIKAYNEIEAMFKKCFEDIAKFLIDNNSERLRQKVENKEN